MSNPTETYSELSNLLSDFTTNVLTAKPTDLKQYAATYFANLAKEEVYSEEDSFDNDSDRESFGSSLEDIMTDKKTKKRLIQSSNIPRQSIICEPFDPSSIDNETFERNRKIFPKTPKQLSKLEEILQTIFLFNCLDEDQVIKVIQSMFLVEYLAGDEIIKEKAPGDNFYVVDNGTFLATDESKTIYEKYDGQGFFGELALLYNCPRAATVTAVTDGALWAIDRITFRQLILKSAYQKRKRFLEFIKSVPILTELSEYDQCNLADALKTKIVSNEKIIIQGEDGDKLYFIEDGEVMVTVQNEDQEEKEITRLSVGKYFGEVALLAKIPRIASVHAIGITKLAELDVKSYDRLMGPCIDRMRSNFTNYQSQLEKILSKQQLQDLFPDLIKEQVDFVPQTQID